MEKRRRERTCVGVVLSTAVGRKVRVVVTASSSRTSTRCCRCQGPVRSLPKEERRSTNAPAASGDVCKQCHSDEYLWWLSLEALLCFKNIPSEDEGTKGSGRNYAAAKRLKYEHFCLHLL